VHVRLTTQLDGRMPAAVEAAAYFSCAEAITNAVKHADAQTISVEARRDAGRLVVEVADDGTGGASLNGGTGLRGLEDRVMALGGRLDLSSPPEGGTRLRVDIPIEDQG
jgi:signal transduction histidine kinase